MPGSVAILGATSRLAVDYARQVAARGGRDLTLFARDPAALERRLAVLGIAGRFPARPIETFGEEEHAAVLNFVGVGDPARAQALGAGIFAVTREWDERAIRYCERAPATRYVFLSSGAVYGDGFAAPADAGTAACFAVNRLGPRHWYGLAKLSAEAGHRARPDLSIIDLRLFNYVSRSADPEARFLIMDAVRAIGTGRPLVVTPAAITRDYLCPADLYALVEAALTAPAGTNAPADAYSRAPIDKAALLALLADAFGLRWQVADDANVPDATGVKPHYYSLDRTAAVWGYRPGHSSADAIRGEVDAMLERAT